MKLTDIEEKALRELIDEKVSSMEWHEKKENEVIAPLREKFPIGVKCYYVPFTIDSAANEACTVIKHPEKNKLWVTIQYNNLEICEVLFEKLSYTTPNKKKSIW